MALTKVTYSMIDGSVFNVKDYGAIGDGTTDDAASIQLAVTAAAGGIVLFEAGLTYLLKDEIIVPENTTIELNGATINFDVVGSVYCFKMSDYTSIKNGTVNQVNTTPEPGVNGSHRCPVTVGSFNTNPGIGNSNVTIENMVLRTSRPNGQCISVYSDSKNVFINNCIIYNDGTAKNGIACHWSLDNSAGASYGTRHPSGITIQNTVIINMQVGIYLSAAYQVNINNCFIYDAITTAVVAYRGDYSNEYASTAIKQFVNKNIVVENVVGRGCKEGIRIDGIDGITAPENIMGVSVNNCFFTGVVAGSSNDRGVYLRGCDYAYIKNTTLAEFDGYGIDFTGSAQNVILENCKIYGTAGSAIYSRDTDIIENVKIQNCRIYDNAASSPISSKPAIRVGSLCKKWTIDNCFFGLTVGETQGTSIEFSVDSEYITIINNHTYGAVDYAYRSLGATSLDKTSKIKLHFMNNTAEPGIVLYNGGILPSIIDNQQNLQVWAAGYPTLSSEGTWVVGDIIWNTSPTSGGNIGWVCTTAGTPGTWKAFGTIA